MQPMHVPAGATIFRTGDPSSAVYLIEDGEIAITVNGDVEVARLHPGDLFGESGVLEARCRSATATAVSPTTLLVTEAETFFRAFGMDNDRALALVKLLCRRLRSTTLRAAQPPSGATEADAQEADVQAEADPQTEANPQAGADSQTGAEPQTAGHAAIRLLPYNEHMAIKYSMAPVAVRHLPFQVGNRYGGETLPMTSNHSCCIPARGETDLAAPHFEILRRDGRIGVRDLGTPNGTIVNGTAITRTSLNSIVSLHAGDNEVIAGRPGSPFRFRIQLAGA